MIADIHATAAAAATGEERSQYLQLRVSRKQSRTHPLIKRTHSSIESHTQLNVHCLFIDSPSRAHENQENRSFRRFLD